MRKSMWTHFCCISLGAEPIFFFFCQDKNWPKWAMKQQKKKNKPQNKKEFLYFALLIFFRKKNAFCIHSKITMAGEVVPYYTFTALVPTLK